MRSEAESTSESESFEMVNREAWPELHVTLKELVAIPRRPKINQQSCADRIAQWAILKQG